MKAKRKLFDVPEYQNLREIIAASVHHYPNNNAFIVKNKEDQEAGYRYITFTEFQDDINSLGTALIHAELQGKRIAIISKNRYEWAVSYFAVVNGVGIAIPLDKNLPPGEIESLLQRSYADAVIFEKEFTDVMSHIKGSGSTQIAQFICMDADGPTAFTSFTSLVQKGRDLLHAGNRRYLESTIDNEAMRVILFTSGTTSISKAVLLSHKNIASNIYGLNSAQMILATDISLAFLPFHHTFGSTGLLFFLSNGAATAFCDGLKYIQKNLAEYKVTVFVCVPLLLEAMYKKIFKEVEKQGKTKLVKAVTAVCKFLLRFGIDIRRKAFREIINKLGGHLRFIVSGASAIDKNVAEGFNNFGILTVQGFGLTETSPVLTAENTQSVRYGSVGPPLINVDLAIENPDENGIGEIIARGPNVMLGYYENEEATNEVLIDGWFHTGDLGYVDNDGYYFITGRKKNVIVLKNGKNIFPEELEILINSLPYVAESMVFGMPKDDDLQISAKIVYNKEYVEEKYPGISKEEIGKIIWQDIKQVNRELVMYKHIKHIIVTDEPMIKTTTAKIKRFEEISRIIN